MVKYVTLLLCCFFQIWTSNGQDTTHPLPAKIATADSLPGVHLSKETLVKTAKPGKHKVEYFKDTIRRERRQFDSTLFTAIKIPSTGDYARDLGKVYETLSSIPGVTGSFSRLESIRKSLDQDDSALDIISTRMAQSDRTFNVRNLQMINTLLETLDNSTDDYGNYLDNCDSSLDEVRDNIADLRNDTLMLRIFRDSSLKATFKPQLDQLKSKWREVDSLVTEMGKDINTLNSQASAHSILIGELQSKVAAELKAVGSRAFGKEQPYLWEDQLTTHRFNHDAFKESVAEENQLTKFYFASKRNNRMWLLIMGAVFFIWIFFNFRSLKRLHKLDALEALHLHYLDKMPVASSLLFMLCLAPLFDLHAPAIYVESIQLFSMIVLTFVLRKKVPKEVLVGWCIFVVLFLLLTIARITLVSILIQRWAYLIINCAALLLGIVFLVRLRKIYGSWIVSVLGLYLFFNLLAILCNLFSRVTLSQIFAYTAAYAFAQLISLIVFVWLVVEAFLVQVLTSRIRKKYPQVFDIPFIAKSIRRFAIIVAIALWLIVLAINLNLFDSGYDLLYDFFTKVRTVGSFNFSIGGILLFLGIIWLANFLQKYVSYFFGDTGDDAAFDDKGQRSKLMVTRLILLIAGFLLAVAASGLAVDRITVILGALGVGVGLGLQNIVNNFVSGVILIFDRPLRIGDTVDIGDKRGRVKEIGIRSSTLLTEDGAEVIIPNGDVLSHNIVNWTLSNNHARVALSFTMEKPANTDALDAEAIKQVVKQNPNVLQQRGPEVTINSINTKNVELEIFFWIIDFNKQALTAAEVKTAIYRHFESKGIVIG